MSDPLGSIKPPAGSHLVQPGTRSVAALQGQIRQTRAQLDDWVTCVSAHTTKGQAEIQSLSAQLSATESQIHRAQSQSTGNSIDVWV